MTSAPQPTRAIWAFLALTCVLSWPIWFASGVLPRAGQGALDFRWLLAQAGVMAPSLAALVVSGVTSRPLRSNSLRALPVLLVPLVVPGILIAASAPSNPAEFATLPSVAALIVAILVLAFFSPLNRKWISPGTGEALQPPDGRWVALSPVFFPVLFVSAWLIVGARSGGWHIEAFRAGIAGFLWIVVIALAHLTLLGGSLGEETGWRGFLLPSLLSRTGPLAASLTLGLVWGLWHLPIDLYGNIVQGPGAILVRIAWALPMSILFTWFYFKSNGSLLVAMLLHTSVNVLPSLGFSEYATSMLVFFFLMTGAAVLVAASSPVFRAVPDPQ